LNNDLKLLIKINPQDIAFLDKIFEAYDGLAIVSTLNRKEGLVVLTVTPETKKDVIEILNNFPRELFFV
jgi:hypothetical protein